ncbi:hypothetical protein [Winogradskyella marincola]|uniref:Lipoprotein n=1 Tax=Winogradskyella marincola TaxID=3037795 RepID=A0ABT6FXN3_9FLAO|nr:hypothetical protein [Winogradskyella sp. YYF002]MDG4714374.1 hypothetical protein [Winogradskyella sp. YYF002]
MKKVLPILYVIIISCSNMNKTSKAESNEVNTTWNQQNREQYLSNRNDSTTWDNEMFNSDKQLIGIGELGPFEIGVFPVPKYELLGEGSFKGLGNKNEDFKVGEKTIVMNSFFVAKNEINQERLDDKADKVFFHLLVLTDTLDTENYNLNKSIAISRNHPDYVGQGFVKTKSNTIDYFAFDTAEGESYAIINTRLFNLNFGKTILIAPKNDGTLRSLQIESPQLTSEAIIAYTDSLIKEKQIVRFFETKNTF